MGRLFGTDGVRGVAGEDMTCELAMDIGRAAATVLTYGRRRRPLVVLGKDTRLSSDMLGAALSARAVQRGGGRDRFGRGAHAPPWPTLWENTKLTRG